MGALAARAVSAPLPRFFRKSSRPRYPKLPNTRSALRPSGIPFARRTILAVPTVDLSQAFRVTSAAADRAEEDCDKDIP